MLLVLGIASFAAERSSGNPAKTDAQTTTSARGRAVTIGGCLSGASDVDVLTELKGTSYRLTRNPAKLSAGAGGEVIVTGAVSTPLSETHGETSSAAARSRGHSQTIGVAPVKQISKTCR